MEKETFDLIELEGEDLRRAAIEHRKHKLVKLVRTPHPGIVLNEHYEGDGDIVFEHACKMGVEGIVAKRRDSIYRSGRTDTWLKLKCKKSDTFPIVAFVEKLGAKPRRIARLRSRSSSTRCSTSARRSSAR